MAHNGVANGYWSSLTIISTYDFYDRPIFFSCKDALDNHYVALLIDEDESHGEKWIYAPTTIAELSALENGSAPTISLFKNRAVFLLNVKKSDISVLRVQSEMLTEEMLPPDNVYV